MAATVERALAMALIQPKINSLIISGPTGVGKSYRARKLLQEWNIPYRTIPVHIQAESFDRPYRFGTNYSSRALCSRQRFV